MKIMLDFDGTCVEHQYPKIGRCNFGCIEVIKKLQDSGHEIVLNTMRVEFNDDSMKDALKWFENSWMCIKNRKEIDNFVLAPITLHTQNKNHPNKWDLDEAIKTQTLYIDDIATGIPLKPCCMIPGDMVDWDVVEEQLIEKGIITV